MVDKIDKALKKLSYKEKAKVKVILLSIKKGDFSKLDAKKLKGYENIYRVRIGKNRIIFQKTENSIKILSLENRSDNTYNL